MLKVYEKLNTGNYNFYVFRCDNWQKVNHKQITEFNKIDEDAISVNSFFKKCFEERNFDKLENFIQFIRKYKF